MYQKLINQQVPFRHKYIWKLKILLKIKIFLWYLLKGVLLTKDNLAKKNWDGSHKCYFCNCNETIQHLFFYCHHAKILWRVVAVATGLPPPSSVAHMSSTWLLDIGAKQRKLILVGVAALCWAIWRCRNDICFNNVRYTFFCRLYSEGHTGCGSGRSCNRQEHRSYSDLWAKI